MLPTEILKSKDIKAIGKLIIYFLLNQKNISDDGGIKVTIEQIADGIGEEIRNVKEHVKKLKTINILRVKAGRYPAFYFQNSIEHHSVPLNGSIEHHSVPLNPPPPPTPIINKVVVVSLEKHGFDFGPVILEKLNRFSVDDQIAAIESTAANAKTNPSRYIEKILDNDCKGIKIKVPKNIDSAKPNEPSLRLGDVLDYNGFQLEIIKRTDESGKTIFGAFRQDTGAWYYFPALDQLHKSGQATVMRN